MKVVKVIAAILLIIGGLAWGSIGLFDFNFISYFLEHVPVVEKVIYILVGVAALVRIFCCKRCCKKS